MATISARFLSTAALALCLTACMDVPATDATNKAVQRVDPVFTQSGGSYADGAAMLAARKAVVARKGKAKNVILFIGDGMGVSTITAGRIYSGQKAGRAGEGYVQTMETLPYAGLVKTYNTNQQVSDSAGTATAIMTGTKTRAGVINVGPEAERQDCAEAMARKLPSLAQIAAKAGRSTGVVSTAAITHATPATVYAHSPDRNWEAPKDISDAAREAGCISIAEQLIASQDGKALRVAMGGGAKEFVSGDENISDGWPGKVVTTGAQMRDFDVDSGAPLLGLFSEGQMQFSRLKDANHSEPSLTQMTSKAIDILSQDDEGYFLMVEAGRIDHGHHAGRAELALEENRQFDLAISDALTRIDLDETLVIITADHSHVFTIAGYPTRGNPILGVVKGNDVAGNPKTEAHPAADGEPYTTLGYQNGPGATSGDRNPQGNDIAMQMAAIPTDYETHAGEDVAVFAGGPGAHLVGGVIEQNVLFHIMHDAMGLNEEPQ